MSAEKNDRKIILVIVLFNVGLFVLMTMILAIKKSPNDMFVSDKIDIQAKELQEKDILSDKDLSGNKIIEPPQELPDPLLKPKEEFEENKILVESFSKDFVLEESSNMESSENPYWWVNSGAFLYANNGTGKTIFGELDEGSLWQKKYEDYNSDETDKGYHPQNIFRLVTKSKWKNYQQTFYAKIGNYHLSNSKHRAASNGLLLFNRYQDGDNLYYTGVRVDGTAIIKKKIKGKYFTMAQKPLFVADKNTYNRNTNPNQIPIQTWVGIRSEVKNIGDKVEIKLYIDQNNTGEWQLVLETLDNGVNYGGQAILSEGYAGIRTDFMDVEFDNYKIIEQ